MIHDARGLHTAGRRSSPPTRAEAASGSEDSCPGDDDGSTAQLSESRTRRTHTRVGRRIVVPSQRDVRPCSYTRTTQLRRRRLQKTCWRRPLYPLKED